METDKKFLDNLVAFSVRGKKEKYTNGKLAKKIKEADGSTSIIHEEIDWKYHDNYFGRGPFGGREVVSYKNKPIFFIVQSRKDCPIQNHGTWESRWSFLVYYNFP